MHTTIPFCSLGERASEGGDSMRFSSARASLWLAVFVAVVMVLPAVSLTVGAAYTYQTNLAKIDPGVLTQGSSDTPSVTSTAGSAPNAASPTIAVIKLKDFASPAWASSGHDFVVDSLEAVDRKSTRLNSSHRTIS